MLLSHSKLWTINRLLSRRKFQMAVRPRARRARAGTVTARMRRRPTAEGIRLDLAAGVGRHGRGLGRDPGDRPRAGLPHGPPGTAHRTRGPRGARPVAIAPPAWPSPRRNRGGSSSASRSRDASGVADRPGPPISRSATTGSGSGGSSPSARSARATRSSPSSRRRRPRPRRRRRRTRTIANSSRCATGCRPSSSFVRLFDRAVGLVPQLEPRELERSLQLLGRVPDATILRLFDLLGGLPDEDVIELVEALSRLSPTAARRATKLMSGVVRTVSR